MGHGQESQCDPRKARKNRIVPDSDGRGACRMQTFKAVVLMSLNQDKVRNLTPEELQRQTRKMTKALRCEVGVRQVEGIQFLDWKAGPGGTPRPPWRPHGTLLFLEARDPDRLGERIRHVFDIANELDQEMMVLQPLGDLDSW